MKNYYVQYELNGKRFKVLACGKNAAEVQAIFSRAYPGAKIIELEIVKRK